MDSKLLGLLVCPVSRRPWSGSGIERTLVRREPAPTIDDGIPVLLPEKARELRDEAQSSSRSGLHWAEALCDSPLSRVLLGFQRLVNRGARARRCIGQRVSTCSSLFIFVDWSL